MGGAFLFDSVRVGIRIQYQGHQDDGDASPKSRIHVHQVSVMSLLGIQGCNDASRMDAGSLVSGERERAGEEQQLGIYFVRRSLISKGIFSLS